MTDAHTITSIEQLRNLFDEPSDRARRKELRKLEKHTKLFLSKSPFVCMATAGPDGADCSPKGDAPGFVAVLDDHTLAIPDRRGNNRVDSLVNLIDNPQVGLLFFIPGAPDTLRINGTAHLSTDPDLRARFTFRGKQPKVVIVVAIEQVYLHCAKALIRAKMWEEDSKVDRTSMPSFSRMLYEQISDTPDEGVIKNAEENYDAYNQKTLY